MKFNQRFGGTCSLHLPLSNHILKYVEINVSEEPLPYFYLSQTVYSSMWRSTFRKNLFAPSTILNPYTQVCRDQRFGGTCSLHLPLSNRIFEYVEINVSEEPVTSLKPYIRVCGDQRFEKTCSRHLPFSIRILKYVEINVSEEPVPSIYLSQTVYPSMWRSTFRRNLFPPSTTPTPRNPADVNQTFGEIPCFRYPQSEYSNRR